MTSHLQWCAVAVLLMATLRHQAVRADETPDTSAARAASLARLIQAVEQYTLTIEAGHGEPLELVKSPVLRYSDPVTSVLDGAVFVWTRNGRPEALISVHVGKSGRPFFEFRSLSSSPLAAMRMGQPEWHPDQPGLDFRPLEGAPSPEETAPQRLKQMRAMLRSFSASISDPADGRHELRLLSQPVFRYSQPDVGILDGALFFFVRATNPELLIVVEAQTAEGNPRWTYSP
ncbi:MAG: hypothetical protein HY000_31625, partial [Planctomycetes bacterium]|nr:hypothetical protein [Planctomycetota bacterium]